MTPSEAAWVRTHVWTPAMRRRRPPDDCVCRRGPSQHCQAGTCGRCHHQTGYPDPETYVTTARGGVLTLPQPYTHPTASASGSHHVGHAMVWLADRVCRWTCPCPCHTGSSPASGTVPRTPPASRSPAGQLDLLTLI